MTSTCPFTYTGGRADVAHELAPRPCIQARPDWPRRDTCEPRTASWGGGRKRAAAASSCGRAWPTDHRAPPPPHALPALRPNSSRASQGIYPDLVHSPDPTCRPGPGARARPTSEPALPLSPGPTCHSDVSRHERAGARETKLLLATQPPSIYAKARNRTTASSASSLSLSLSLFFTHARRFSWTNSFSASDHPIFVVVVGHGDDRRGAAARPAGWRCRRRAAGEEVGGGETAVVGGEERGVRDGRPRRRRAGLQGAGGGVAAGEGVPEERVPRRGGGGGEGRAGGEEGRSVREGEHGRGALPPEGGPADVRRVQGAEGRAGRALRLLLLLGRRRRPVRRRLRGQGRRPHARRRRALGDVHLFVQEAEDHEGVRSKEMRETSTASMQEVVGRVEHGHGS